jgi:hypothetical protein
VPTTLTWFGRGNQVDLTVTPPFGLSANAFVALELLAVVAAIGLWLLLLAAVLMWTRPADVDPLPANADFPDDVPPAVVSLLANRWRLNEDAAEATLLDLAARHWIELRQPGNDPTHTTVHMLPPPIGAGQPPLTPYDEQVLRHVREAAVDDVVPVTALTFRDVSEASRWTQRLHGSVIDDARARGLTRRRFSPLLVTTLSVLALLPALVAAVVVMTVKSESSDSFSDQFGAGAGAALLLWAALSGVAGRPLGERDTPLGREVAARWFGLRTFLRNDGAFADLPPASVTVWDRYLSYGDALGVTRVCSALLDLGMGNRKRVWSSYGGSWHRVRVRYPRVLARYGATVPALLIRAAIGLVVGGFLVHILKLSTFDFPDTKHHLIGDIPLLIGLLLFGYGAYLVLRTAGDLLVPRTLTGEVLWVELWKTKQQKNSQESVPVVHYFAVDDGSGERTTAWAIPSDWAYKSRAGDVVTIVVRPWSRRVTTLTVDSSRAKRLAEANAANAVPPTLPTEPTPSRDSPRLRPVGPANFRTPQGLGDVGLGGVVLGGAGVGGAGVGGAGLGEGALGGAVAPVLATAMVAAAAGGRPTPPLLTADEVTEALGRPVVTDAHAGRFSLGPFEMVMFSLPGTVSPVVMLAVARGRAVQLVMRTVRGGTQLPGIGDEAWQGPDWAVARRGEAMIRINLETGSNLSPQILPTLLSTAVSRLP